MNLRLSGLCLALVTLAVSSVGAESSPSAVLGEPIRHSAGTVEVSLRGADAATLSRTLGDALGGMVQIQGGAPPTVTLDLEGVSARVALDAVAGALRGSWRPVYTVGVGTATLAGRRPIPLGRMVNADLENVSARAALALVARAGGGTLQLVGDLPKSVTLVAKEMPVEQALDDLAQQTGATWSVAYVIKAGVAPPSPRPTALSGERPLSRAPVLGLASPDAARQGSTGPRAFPIPFAGQIPSASPAPATGAEAGKLLAQGLAQVMQMPSPQRQNAVKDFAKQLDQQFRLMQSLPAPRRSEQMAAMRPVYEAARRTSNGLTPDQRREFQPIIDVFTRWMR